MVFVWLLSHQFCPRLIGLPPTPYIQPEEDGCFAALSILVYFLVPGKMEKVGDEILLLTLQTFLQEGLGFF
jgi:hypothetical protein